MSRVNLALLPQGVGAKLLPGEMFNILGWLSGTSKSQESRTDEVLGSALWHKHPLFKVFPVVSGSIPRYAPAVSPSLLTRSGSLLLPTGT